jgi:hypothetical protein
VGGRLFQLKKIEPQSSSGQLGVDGAFKVQALESALQKSAKQGEWREVMKTMDNLLKAVGNWTLSREVLAEWASSCQESPYPLVLIAMTLLGGAGFGDIEKAEEGRDKEKDDVAYVLGVARQLGPGNPVVYIWSMIFAAGVLFERVTMEEVERMFKEVVKAIPGSLVAHHILFELKELKVEDDGTDLLAFAVESAVERSIFFPLALFASPYVPIPPGADAEVQVVWGKLLGTGYDRDRLLGLFDGEYSQDPELARLAPRRKAPSLQATAVLNAIARLAQVDEARQWARRMAVETWLLPTQPPRLFGSTPFRQELADSSTRNCCDCCYRKIMSDETWWHVCDVDVCEACLAAARRFDTSSITLDMRTPAYKPSSAASRVSRPKSRRGAAHDDTPVAALAVAVVVPHDDRAYGGGPPSEAMLERELVDDGRYLVRWEDKSTAEIRVSNGAFTCQGSNYKLKPGVKPATIVWPDSTSQVLKEVEAERSVLTLTWTTSAGALIRWTYLGS